MQTLNEALKEIEKNLVKISDSWHVESRRILCHVLNCEPIDLVLSKSRVLTDREITEIHRIIDQRYKRYPLQYSLGVQNFYGYDFDVNSNVLIPRPETECLVEFLIMQGKNNKGRFLDIGVGSGAIVISFAKKCPEYECVGIDISSEALMVAKSNGEKNLVSERITWIKSDLFGAISDETFDIIVSNPPYIPAQDAKGLEPEVLDYEPHVALFGGVDGLDFYRRIIPEALVHLHSGGLLAFEAGHDQYKAIETLFQASGYVEVGHFNDLNDIPRFIYGYKAPIGG